MVRLHANLSGLTVLATFNLLKKPAIVKLVVPSGYDSLLPFPLLLLVGMGMYRKPWLLTGSA